MLEPAALFIAIGCILLLGLATDFIGRRTALPRVTLLLILGIVLGEEVLGLIPESLSNNFDFLAQMALMMIGFLLGGRLTLESLKRLGRQIAWISILASLGTALVVVVALIAIGVALPIAILLGCMASATAPAATLDTVLESRNQTAFSTMLLAIVAIDDAWALLLFSVGLALLSFLSGAQEFTTTVFQAGYEIGVGIFLGVFIGIPAAFLTGRLKPGQPILAEALGLVFLCGGAAILLNASFLLAVMTMGAVIANLSRHHEYPFHEIENVEWPFMAMFFVLAGASLEIALLPEIGLVGATYVLARSFGKIAGGWVGGWAGGTPTDVRNWVGIAMLPQAGVTIGMGLITVNRFPEYRDLILTTLIGTTVLFELFGPPLTRLALNRTSRLI
jgi:Kef-type K+ transport system membrane component KefB